MTFKNGDPKPEASGRKPSVANVQTRSVRQAIALAAHKLGGAERLYEWAKESAKNEFAFWTSIYPRLLPVKVEGTGVHGEIEMNVAIAPNELAQKLAEHGLPAVMFGYDKASDR
jgi:hypothetical protein